MMRMYLIHSAGGARRPQGISEGNGRNQHQVERA